MSQTTFLSTWLVVLTQWDGLALHFEAQPPGDFAFPNHQTPIFPGLWWHLAHVATLSRVSNIYLTWTCDAIVIVMSSMNPRCASWVIPDSRIGRANQKVHSHNIQDGGSSTTCWNLFSDQVTCRRTRCESELDSSQVAGDYISDIHWNVTVVQSFIDKVMWDWPIDICYQTAFRSPFFCVASWISLLITDLCSKHIEKPEAPNFWIAVLMYLSCDGLAVSLLASTEKNIWYSTFNSKNILNWQLWRSCLLLERSVPLLPLPTSNLMDWCLWTRCFSKSSITFKEDLGIFLYTLFVVKLYKVCELRLSVFASS